MPLLMRPRWNDEADNAVWKDLSGKGHDGTLSGFAFTEASGWGSDPPRLVLDGSNDYVQVADAADLRPGTGDYSYDVWLLFPLSGANPFGAVIVSGDIIAASAGTWSMARSFSATNAVRVYDVATAGSFNLQWTFPTIADGWHHLAVTRTSGVYRMYIDGAQSGSAITPAQTADLNRTEGIKLGRTSDRYLGASIAASRLYKGIGLSAAQVTQNHSAGPTGWGYVRDGLVLDLNAAYVVPVVPKMVYASGQEAFS